MFRSLCCCCFGGGDEERHGDPPLLNSSFGASPSSPRAIRGRATSSASEYIAKVINICKIGQGTFATVSLVIDRTVLEALDDSDSSLPAFFAVKRISKRGEMARLGPGEGGALAERRTHALLQHPFFPVLHSASRSTHNFYIAFPFALGGDVSKALARRANSIRGFDKKVAHAIHAQAQVGGTLAGMNDIIVSGLGHQQNEQQKQAGGIHMPSPFASGNGGSDSGKAKKRNSICVDPDNFNVGGTPDGELRATLQGLPIGFVFFVAFELLSAIAHLNDKGFTHYDIRPGNLLVGDGGHVILGDFGMIREENNSGGTGSLTSPRTNHNNNNNNNGGGKDGSDGTGMFGRAWKAVAGGANNSSSAAAVAPAAAPPSAVSTASASTVQGSTASLATSNSAIYNNNNNNASNAMARNKSFGQSSAVAENEKRSQLYLAPEHLNIATNIEAENDGRRLSDVWSYGVLVLELALGSHPFAPVSSASPSMGGDNSNAFAMLTAIKRMQFRRVPTTHLQPHSESVVRAVELLNDLVSKIFVPRTERQSASLLMQHEFFASPEVRALVCAGGKAALQQPLAPTAEPMNGGPASSASLSSSAAATASPAPSLAEMSNSKFFEQVVKAKRLRCPDTMNPNLVCKKRGCPRAGVLKRLVATIAPCPNSVAAHDFAPTLHMDALSDELDDSCELIDLRFFGSLSESDLRTWTNDDNFQCLASVDLEWAPENMKCSRKPSLSSHTSFGGGGTAASEAPNFVYGVAHQHGGGGAAKAVPPMPEQAGFTFVRPTSTTFGQAARS